MGDKILKEGFLIKRAMKSGRNWKKRYFVLTAAGVISYSDKKGDPAKNKVQLTSESQVSIIPDGELGGDSGFCISSPGHNPLYLKVKKSERDVAEQWLAEITRLIKALGGESGQKLASQYEGIYNPVNTLGRSKSNPNIQQRRRKGTLERVKKGQTKSGDSPEGWQMKIGKTKGAPDYFVSSKTWEYYASAEDCKEGKPALGKALLALLV